MELILQQNLPHQQTAIDAVCDALDGIIITPPVQFYENPQINLVYCDEDRVRDGHVCEPEFKTFPNYGSLYARNYVKHLLAMSASVAAAIELSMEDVSGAQAYDLTLKAFEVAHKVSHVPRVLYHARWRDEMADLI